MNDVISCSLFIVHWWMGNIRSKMTIIFLYNVTLMNDDYDQVRFGWLIV